MAERTFVGCWINRKIHKKLKVACIVHDVNQQDIVELLILKWLKNDHIQDEIKELINEREKNRN